MARLVRALLLAGLLLGACCQARQLSSLSSLVQNVEQVFGGGGGGDNGQPSEQSKAQGPIAIKVASALLAAGAGEGLPSNASAQPAAEVPFGGGNSAINGSVAVLRPGPHRVVLAFRAGNAPVDAGAWSNDTQRVRYLAQWVYTSQAPAQLLQLFGGQLVQGTGSPLGGSLAQAVEQVAGGDEVLHVLCTGQGAGGGLAMLCGPWAALLFPTANVDVITFGAPWAGFNTQFAWSFTRLVSLSYFWNFTSSDLGANVTSNASASDGGGGGDLLAAVAERVSQLVTTDALLAAVTLPNLPASYPPDYPNDMGESLGDLEPIEPELEPQPGPCPVILCKTRQVITDACLIFGDNGMQTQLQGLPKARLHSVSGADAVVAWDNSTGSAIILWEGSESKIDWLQDAILYQSDDFRPGQLDKIIPGVKVHRGFLNQFSSFTTDPSKPEDNITAVVYNFTGGQQPWRVVVTGHSLGAALSELTAVWASTVWPAAHVFVANTGAPMAGDKDWVQMFQAVVGRAFRYVNHLDQVPSLPPFGSFQQVPEGIWLRNDLALLQDRPPYTREQTTWNDHHCETLYVPEINNASAVTVPQFVYNATAA